MYWLGQFKRLHLPKALGNTDPTAEKTALLYARLVMAIEEPRRLRDIDTQPVPVAHPAELLASETFLSHRCLQSASILSLSLVNYLLPTDVRDIQRRLGWDSLLTQNRRTRIGIISPANCPNCGHYETPKHVFDDRVVARPCCGAPVVVQLPPIFGVA